MLYDRQTHRFVVLAAVIDLMAQAVAASAAIAEAVSETTPESVTVPPPVQPRKETDATALWTSFSWSAAGYALPAHARNRLP